MLPEQFSEVGTYSAQEQLDPLSQSEKRERLRFGIKRFQFTQSLVELGAVLPERRFAYQVSLTCCMWRAMFIHQHKCDAFAGIWTNTSINQSMSAPACYFTIEHET
jgi:hypothetical protein